MFQQKMIEQEKDLSCSQNHNQPIHMVVIDKKLKRQERLLCTICMENYQAHTSIIGFKKVLKDIEDNQKNKLDFMYKLIEVEKTLVEQFQNELNNIQSNLFQQFQDIITQSNYWIENLNEIGKNGSQYSFYDELEKLIDNPKPNSFYQEQIIKSIKEINDSFYHKINSKLSNLKHLVLNSQCEKFLQNVNLSYNIKLIDNSIKQTDLSYVKKAIDNSITYSNSTQGDEFTDYSNKQANPNYIIKLIDNSTKQTIPCYAISFNISGSLMISTSNQDIKVWNFAKGQLKEISTQKGHTITITSLQFSQKSNSFVSAGYDNSIRCWKQINEKEWKSSQPYQKHTNCINCLILNQSENELVSGGCDYSIKIWQIDFIKNELDYLYSLDKHKNYILSLCFNQSENTMVSCGQDKQIIIWKKDSRQKWYFEYVVTQTFEEFGRLFFINEDKFIFVTGNQESMDCINTFELKTGKYQENKNKQVRLIKNDKDYDTSQNPIICNKERSLMIVKHKYHVYLIKIQNEGKLQIITQIGFESTDIQVALSNDGRYLVVWKETGQNYDIYEILIS